MGAHLPRREVPREAAGAEGLFLAGMGFHLE